MSKESNFYDPIQVPVTAKDDVTYQKINVVHNRFQHASANEMKNMLKLHLKELEGLNTKDIDNWYDNRGRFCSGCAEGKLKEHARVRSTKPLQAEVPG